MNREQRRNLHKIFNKKRKNKNKGAFGHGKFEGRINKWIKPYILVG